MKAVKRKEYNKKYDTATQTGDTKNILKHKKPKDLETGHDNELTKSL